MKTKTTDSVLSKNKFTESIFRIGSRFSIHKVFDDFLTMSICACTQNPETKKSYYEEDYLETIAYYKDSELRHEFPKAFASLVCEMEERVNTSLGNDVLGEFFEQNISNGRNGQFFTPYPICQFMSSITQAETASDEKPEKQLRILDPSCGSGRMLLAAHKTNGAGHRYFGIDVDRVCVKMAALNLFLNGVWHSEVMCANALMPDDFVISYSISLFPLGIFKVQVKEHSLLYYLQQNSFPKREKKNTGESIVLDKTPIDQRPEDTGSQLVLF